MILCGMMAGNSVQTTMLRALAGLFGGYLIGSTLGMIGAFVARENTGPTAEDRADSPQGPAETSTAADQPPAQAA